MRRTTTVLIAATFAALAVVPAGWADPQPDPTKACKKGRALGGERTGTALPQDQNQNGFVCVDPATGEVTDDKEQFAPDEPGTQSVDGNGNFLVCYDAQQGVITDDEVHQDPDNPALMTFSCPPGYVLFPLFPFVNPPTP